MLCIDFQGGGERSLPVNEAPVEPSPPPYLEEEGEWGERMDQDDEGVPLPDPDHIIELENGLMRAFQEMECNFGPLWDELEKNKKWRARN